MYAEPSFFKTVREIELEQKVADLERALMRVKYGGDKNRMIMPPYTDDLTVNHVAPDAAYVRLPKVASVECKWDKKSFPRHLMVAAHVTVPRPFGLNYYVDAGLIADNAVAAQVLGHLHEKFIRQLAAFVEKENKMDIAKSNDNLPNE